MSVNGSHKTNNPVDDQWMIAGTNIETIAETNMGIEAADSSQESSDAFQGNLLFEREIPEDYLQAWTETIAQPKVSSSTVLSALLHSPEDAVQTNAIASSAEMISAIVFRLQDEWFAIPTQMLQEVVPLAPIHALPHRTTELFLGMVNLHGEVLLCASLRYLLGVEAASKARSSDVPRLIVVGKPEAKWVVPVDHVYRIVRFASAIVQNAPSVITKAKQTYIQGIIDWQNEKVNYLNADQILESLAQKIL